MHRHLVSVKVSIIGSTYQGMKLNRFSLNKNRLKCLYPKSMQRRRTVKQNRMLLDYFIKYVPNFRSDLFYHPLCTFYVMSTSVFNKKLHNKRFEQFKGHLLWQTTLIKFQFRSDNDNRTSGIVDSLTQKVLSESSLFTL